MSTSTYNCSVGEKPVDVIVHTCDAWPFVCMRLHVKLSTGMGNIMNLLLATCTCMTDFTVIVC